MPTPAESLAKLTSGQTLTAEDRANLNMAAPTVTKTVATMTQAEKDAATAATIAAGGKSTDPANRLPGESASAANARIAAGYKEMLAKPVLSAEAQDAGATVKFVRTDTGGVGSYTVVTPIGYNGPDIKTTEWTAGIIPSNSPYTTGTTLGVYSKGDGTYTSVNGTPVTTKPSTISTTPPPSGKTVSKVVDNGDGTKTTFYTDGTSSVSGTKTTTVVTPDRPIGTPPAYVYDANSKTWVQPAKPSTAGNWVWDNLNGWVNSTVTPGATGTSAVSTTTLAKDTFKNTLALYFGASEMSQPWVDALYGSVSSFYKTGSTVQEALNLSLADIRNNPVLKPFTDRFKGLYALQDRLAKGEAISVPTIAEYFKSESDLGDIMRGAGLGDLATQEFLGGVLGTGKSVSEASNIISDVFNAIDNAPKSLKDTLSQYFPGVDRVSLAKALLTGAEGAAALSKKVKQVSVLSAAGTQGLTVDMATAGDIAAMGYDYGQSLTGFGQVARELGTYQKIKEMESGKPVSTAETQTQLQNVVFGKDIQDQLALEAAAQREANRFRGQAGNIGSKALASQVRGLI